MTPAWDPKQLMFRTSHWASIWARKHIFLSNRRTCPLVHQESMSPCSTRGRVLLLKKKTGLPVQQDDVSCCWRRRHFFLLNNETCLPVGQEDMSSCWNRRHVLLPNKMTCLGAHVFLLSKTTCLLVQQEDVSSCSTRRSRRHVVLFNKTGLHVVLLSKETCPLACWNRRHIFLPSKQPCRLVGQEDQSPCSTRRHELLLNTARTPTAVTVWVAMSRGVWPEWGFHQSSACLSASCRTQDLLSCHMESCVHL